MNFEEQMRFNQTLSGHPKRIFDKYTKFSPEQKGRFKELLEQFSKDGLDIYLNGSFLGIGRKNKDNTNGKPLFAMRVFGDNLYFFYTPYHQYESDKETEWGKSCIDDANKRGGLKHVDDVDRPSYFVVNLKNGSRHKFQFPIFNKEFWDEIRPELQNRFLSFEGKQREDKTQYWPIDYSLEKPDPNEEDEDDQSQGESPALGAHPLNKILYGPPGTGKTYITAERAVGICDPEFKGNDDEIRKKYKELLEDGHIAFITFHQSFGYEDFVEGIRPVLVSQSGGSISYELHHGIFKVMCKKAEAAPEQRFVLIIDEINRANISKTFGELITLLEDDKRIGGKYPLRVRLPYSGKNEEFGVPKNLYIIGTMNTADRSIALLDTALRRRFEFEEMMPKPELLKEINASGVDVEKMLRAINSRIEFLYDRDHAIGHAYFMDVESLDGLERVFRHKIIPLLQEYFYEDWGKIDLVLNKNKFIVRIPRPTEIDGEEFSDRMRFKVAEKLELDKFKYIYEGGKSGKEEGKDLEG